MSSAMASGRYLGSNEKRDRLNRDGNIRHKPQKPRHKRKVEKLIASAPRVGDTLTSAER